MKTRWSRGEILGRRLYWLVDIVFAGATIRLSTRDLTVSSDGGDLHYTGTAEAIRLREEVSLFALTSEPVSVTLNAHWPVDVAQLVSRGHRLGGCVVTVSQWVQGTAYESKCVRLIGRIADPKYGRDGYVSCSIVENLFEDTTLVPPDSWVMREGRFNDLRGGAAGLLGDADLELPYPIPIGYPGKDPQAYQGWTSAMACLWINKATSHHFLLVGAGHLDAAQVWLNNNDYPVGLPFNVLTGFDDAGVPVTYVGEANTGDFTNGFDGLEDAGVDTSFQVAQHTNTVLYGALRDGGGVLGPKGRPIRTAGEVMEFVLGFSNAKIDRGGFASAIPLLTAFRIDTVIDDHVKPWEWVQEQLLPLLPVSLVSGPKGYRPIVWRYDATSKDAVAHIDADADPRIEVAESVDIDSSEVQNDFTLRYGLQRRTGNHLYSARLGAKYVPGENKARARFVRQAGSSNTDYIYVSAIEAGAAGVGIRVFLDETGTNPPAVTDTASTSTVRMEYDDAVTTTAELVTEFQTSTLVTAADDDDTSAWATAVIEDADQTLKLVDDAILPHPLCALSQRELRDPDRNDDGVRPWEKDTHLVWDKATAYAILNWRAAAFATQRRRLSLLVPEGEWGWLARGCVVTFSYSRLSFSRQVGIVESLEWGSDGLLGIRLAFIEDPFRDGFSVAA